MTKLTAKTLLATAGLFVVYSGLWWIAGHMAWWTFALTAAAITTSSAVIKAIREPRRQTPQQPGRQSPP